MEEKNKPMGGEEMKEEKSEEMKGWREQEKREEMERGRFWVNFPGVLCVGTADHPLTSVDGLLSPSVSTPPSTPPTPPTLTCQDKNK